MATIDTKDSPRTYGPNADYPPETGYSVPRQVNNDMLGWGIFAIVVAAVVLFGAYHYRHVIAGTPTEASYSTTTGESSNSTDTSGNTMNRDSSAAMPGSENQSNTLSSPDASGTTAPQTAAPADNATGSTPSSGTSSGSPQGSTY